MVTPDEIIPKININVGFLDVLLKKEKKIRTVERRVGVFLQCCAEEPRLVLNLSWFFVICSFYSVSQES